ncbi:hypothetical protein [Streptomyces decoyicus]|uniref:hypothetical protein n=1 Tax=Streptomyces decoyicus TaxID=249567 RepID=UPI003816DA36
MSRRSSDQRVGFAAMDAGTAYRNNQQVFVYRVAQRFDSNTSAEDAAGAGAQIAAIEDQGWFLTNMTSAPGADPQVTYLVCLFRRR